MHACTCTHKHNDARRPFLPRYIIISKTVETEGQRQVDDVRFVYRLQFCFFFYLI